MIIFCAMVSYYTGFLVVKVANKTDSLRFEDFAFKLYGSKCRTFTSTLNLVCLMGFLIAYIVYVKTMLPTILLLFWTEDELPDFMINDGWGEIFWGTVFSFCFVLPMSIPRSINALRFTSLLSVLCSVYLCLAVVFVFYCDDDLVPDRG